MKYKNLSFIVATIALVIFQASTASAQGPRKNWFYDNGYFHDLNNGNWSETIDGHHTFDFVEFSRDDASVVLLDRTREMFVKLTNDHMELAQGFNAPFTYFKPGRWDDRRIFYHREANGQQSYFILGVSQIWKHVIRDGVSDPNWPVLYRELSRDGQVITLYNAAKDEYMFLHHQAVNRRIGSVGVIELVATGVWGS